MKPVRWGILGASNFARKHMAPAIHAAKGAELVALATSHSEKAAGFLEFVPGLKIHQSYDDLLDDPSIDAVYMPLPNHLHVEWAEKALAKGKHVLVEKPVGMNVAEVDRLIAARDAAQGLLASEAFMILHHPQWAQARDWLKAGEIGELIHVDAVFTYRNLDQANIRNRADAGGGSLRDIGVYTLGSMRFVTGAEPVALESRVIEEAGVDSFAHVFGMLQGEGAAFSFSSTTSMRAYNRQVVTFQGTKGMIRLEGGCFNANVNDLAEAELHQGGNRVSVTRYTGINHYVLQVEAFSCNIREGGSWPVPLEFSRGTQAMMDQAFAKAKPLGG